MTGQPAACPCACCLLPAGLRLRQCSFPVVALPALRPPMLQLQELRVDLTKCPDVHGGVLATVLLLLCRPYGGQPQLRELDCRCWADEVNCGEVERSVLEQLANGFGLTGIRIRVSEV